MPRGQKEPTSPEWARRKSDETILAELEKFPDGLRFQELVGQVVKRISKPTCSAGLQRLTKKNLVEYDSILKRYRITKHGLEDLRLLNVIRVMQTGFGILPPLPNLPVPLPRKAFFAGLFGYARTSRSKSSNAIGIGFALAGEKKRKLSWKSWLYYITNYAVTRDLIQLRGDAKEILPEDLIRIWKELFPDRQEIVIAEYVNSQELLEWLKTPSAKRVLQDALRDFPQDVLEVR